jgi:tetratricopeptide (TPR) repeat protein
MVTNNPDDFFLLDPDLDELERLSNGALDLIESGRLDEAERTCLELERRFPDTIDWLERTAALHEARGEVSRAIEHFRRCIDFIDQRPDDFDPETRASYGCEIERLQSGQKVDRG